MLPCGWMDLTWQVSIKALHMDEFAASRGMATFSTRSTGRFFWRWHYRAQTVQRLLEQLITCWIDRNYPANDAGLLTDPLMLEWWQDLQQFMPAVAQTLTDDPGWLSDGRLTRDALVKLSS